MSLPIINIYVIKVRVHMKRYGSHCKRELLEYVVANVTHNMEDDQQF